MLEELRVLHIVLKANRKGLASTWLGGGSQNHSNAWRAFNLWLTFQRFGPLSSWWGAWSQAGSPGSGEGAEFYIQLRSQQKEAEILDLVWAFNTSKPVPVTHFLSNSATPWGPSIQLYKPMGANPFQTVVEYYLHFFRARVVDL